MNQLHIDERADRTEAELAGELRDRTSPRSGLADGYRLWCGGRPSPARPSDPPWPSSSTSSSTRDVWMHRVDVCRATDRPLRLTSEHDGRIVADVVREWADRRGQPFTLSLTGPAGGTFVGAGGGPALELDAIEFCRTLSGRVSGDGLLAIQVAF